MAGSSIDFRVSFDERPALQSLSNLAALTSNMEPVLRDIGEYLDLSHRLRWDREESPGGKPWAPLNPATLSRKARNGRNRGILVERGNLRDLLSYQISGESLFYGTNQVYGSAQHFGRPEINLPARPWLGISDDDERAIEDILVKHLSDITGR